MAACLRLSREHARALHERGRASLDVTPARAGNAHMDNAHIKCILWQHARPRATVGGNKDCTAHH